MTVVPNEQEKKTIEVRGFLQLDAVFKKRNWPRPMIMELEEPITGAELAEKLDFCDEEIEIVFVNGWAQNVEYTIHPGDRVAFVPPGCPGPHRVYLGFIAKNRAKYDAKKEE